MNPAHPPLTTLFNELSQQLGVTYSTLHMNGPLYGLARAYVSAYLAEGLMWPDEDICLLVGEVNSSHDERYYGDQLYREGYDKLVSAICGYKYKQVQREPFVAAVRIEKCSVFAGRQLNPYSITI